jgi:hypothetical protein
MAIWHNNSNTANSIIPFFCAKHDLLVFEVITDYACFKDTMPAIYDKF